MDKNKILAKVKMRLALTKFNKVLEIIDDQEPISMPRIFKTWVKESNITDKNEIKEYLEELKEKSKHKLNSIFKKGLILLAKDIYKIPDFKID